uniref:CHK kinase-like domain-containing protein n=1 Tax=Timema shepardi TaxID=629360 RepID=A0A7R9G8E5_TIMSH|nr:unnamed protein product [Timema shepardi]
MSPQEKTPATLPWLTDEFLQKILRDAGGHETTVVTSSDIKPMAGGGDNYLSTMYRVSVKTKDKEEAVSTISLVVKLPPSGAEMMKLIANSSAFLTEIKLLSDILPKMFSLLRETSPEEQEEFGAKCFYAKNTMPYVLIMEDLASKGFRMAERQKGLDLRHSIVVMRSLARYHATAIALHKRDPALVESFEENFYTDSRGFVSNATLPMLRSLAEVVRSWPGFGDDYRGRLLKRADTIYDDVMELMKPEGNAFNVLNHGDLWVNNMLFRYEEVTGEVRDVKFVDFQLCRYMSPGIDLQYFIHTSVAEEIRAERVGDLLREYHKTLCATLEDLRCADSIITFQELVDEYERKALFGFFVTTMILPILLSDPDTIFNPEQSHQKEDEAIVTKRISNIHFTTVLKRLLPIYAKKNFF